jgi:hypothetical protein
MRSTLSESPLRQKLFEVGKRFDRAKLPGRCDVSDDGLVIA